LYQDPVGTYNPLPFKNLSESLPEVDFPTFFAAYTPRAFPSLVIQTYPAYASSLSAILKDTSSNVLEAYLIVRAGLTFAPYLSLQTEAWKAQRTLVENLSGIKPGSIQDRTDYCLNLVETELGFAAGRYFANITFGGDSRTKAEKVITDIIDSFKTSLKDLGWMDPESAQAAAEKADALRVKVGYPRYPDTTNPHSVLAYYSLFKVKEDAFFENMLTSATSSEYRKWQKLGKTRNMEEWEMPPSMVNAYYNPPGNEVSVLFMISSMRKLTPMLFGMS
jgi:endothelin-converting enzyme